MDIQTVWEVADVYQRERLRELTQAFRQLREEIVRHANENDVVVVEPRLASPRSSLDPRLI